MKSQLLKVSIFVWAITLSYNIAALEGDVLKVASLLEKVAVLMQAGDMESLNEIYAPGRGVHIIEGARANHGWDEYRDHHLIPELAGFKNFTIRYFAIEPQVREKIAYSPFRYELSADLVSGHIEIEGRGTAILEKIDKQWRIVHIHTSGQSK